MKQAIIIVIDDMPNATWSQELNRMMKYTIEYEDGNWVAHIEVKAGEQNE